jgi:hypothetical protein
MVRAGHSGHENGAGPAITEDRKMGRFLFVLVKCKFRISFLIE